MILDSQERVLLVKHHPSDSPRKFFWKGKWICPGGMLEFGEGLEEGARREVKEETGLDIEPVRALAPSDRLIRWKGKKYLQVVYVDFLARVRQGAPERDGRVAVEPGDDVGMARWFTYAELERLGRELHADARALLERAGVRFSVLLRSGRRKSSRLSLHGLPANESRRFAGAKGAR